MRWRKKMKKRLFALATAVVMTLSMGMTAMAAKSPVVDDTPSDEGVKYLASSATAMINGQKVELEFTWDYLNMRAEATDAQLQQLNYYMPTDSVPAGDEEALQRFREKTKERTRELFEKIMGYRDESAERKDFFGLALPTGYTMPAEGVEVTINAPYAGSGEYDYYVFHCKENGTWEYIPMVEGNGTFTGKFTSFSPVIVVQVPKQKTSSNTEAPSTGNTEVIKPTTVGNTATTSTQNVTSTTSNTTAPKTGDFTGIYVAGMLAIFSAIGIVIYVKEKKIVK